jgi:uncharacterized membrane protein HdeD (DUF308 family)
MLIIIPLLSLRLSLQPFQRLHRKNYIFSSAKRLEENSMTETVEKGLKKIGVTVSKPVLALIAVIFGLLVIVLPELLQVIVGLYFIIQGVLLFTDYMETRQKS